MHVFTSLGKHFSMGAGIMTFMTISRLQLSHRCTPCSLCHHSGLLRCLQQHFEHNLLFACVQRQCAQRSRDEYEGPLIMEVRSPRSTTADPPLAGKTFVDSDMDCANEFWEEMPGGELKCIHLAPIAEVYHDTTPRSEQASVKSQQNLNVCKSFLSSVPPG